MAFALTKFLAYGIDNTETVRTRGLQRVVMIVTAAATDVSMDIGNLIGTFWTAAQADPIYGGLATKALSYITQIAAGALVFSATKGTIANNYNKAPTAATATDYALSLTSNIPTYTFDTASAPTAAVVIMEWELSDGVVPVTADLGA
jgi:hypothetical protein